MSRPLPNEWAIRFSAAFAAALPVVDEDLTDEQARELALEAERAALEQVRGYAVHVLMGEAKAIAAGRERADLDQKRQAAERDRIERDGAKALRKAFGGKTAAAVDLWRSYTIVEAEGHVLAIQAGQEDTVQAAVRGVAPGSVLELTGKSARGYQLATITDELDLVVDDDPSDAARIVAATAHRRQQEALEERKRAAEVARLERERREREREFGVADLD